MNYQRVTILGHATADAEEIKLPPKEGSKSKRTTNLSTFTVAVNYNRYSGEEKIQEANFYECLLFTSGKQKSAFELVKKGDLISVHGRPEVEAYTSKSGEARAKLKLIVEDWQVLK